MECGLGIVYHSATSGQGFIHKVEGHSVGENCSGAWTWGSGVEKSFFSSKEPLEKGGSACQPARPTWNRMEETGLS